MDFPKFHGVQLADGSWVENLHINQFPTDPNAQASGKVWINSTESSLKFSAEENGSIVTHEAADKEVVSGDMGYIQGQINTIASTFGITIPPRGELPPPNEVSVIDGGNF